ncbi:hypothetical protein GCM10009841_19920 [Microlunatus panaciterrae]|uniref:Uncharacterized protein n=1 Tax=Microlunatus panaciterrae TaxID=400768 RepID=A0ABS2RNG7_9ACTN|nr:hypothetical protein [Microlunatus panaciterrae]MBM7800545.1 hypothetical protein [Microlunatus panaciterrae]
MEHPVARHAAISERATRPVEALAVRDLRPRHAQALADSRQRKAKSPGGIFALAAAVLLVIISLAVVWLISRPASTGVSAPIAGTAEAPRSATARTTSDGGNASGDPVSTGAASFQLTDPVDSAKPFQVVPIRGVHLGGTNTVLQVQRMDRGRWVSFPVPTVTDESGHFATYVELGKPGRYSLRVLDPASGAASRPFVLVIKG